MARSRGAVASGDLGIWYGSWGSDGIRSCGIGVFGEDRRIRLRPGRLAVPIVTRRLTLVDLCADGAMHAAPPPSCPSGPTCA